MARTRDHERAAAIRATCMKTGASLPELVRRLVYGVPCTPLRAWREALDLPAVQVEAAVSVLVPRGLTYRQLYGYERKNRIGRRWDSTGALVDALLIIYNDRIERLHETGRLNAPWRLTAEQLTAWPSPQCFPAVVVREHGSRCV